MALRSAGEDARTTADLEIGAPVSSLARNRNANSTKQRQRVSVRFADVASWRVGGGIADQWFHPPRVGYAGERLE
jgi:hypothetical protein